MTEEIVKVKPKNAGHFKKGNKLGKIHSKGRPPLTAQQRAVRLASRQDVRQAMIGYSTLSIDEIEKKLEDRSLSVLDVAILRKLYNTMKHGEADGVDWTLDHIMGGKPKESVVTVNKGNKIDLNKMSGEQLQQLKKIIEQQEASNNGNEDL